MLNQLRANHAGAAERTARLHELLLVSDFAGLQYPFTAFFASIPSDWFRNNPIAHLE